MLKPWKGHEWGAKKIEKLFEWGKEIGIKEASYKNRGKLGVHPIFKEIRECIKLIGVTRQKIGINISLETPDPHSVFQGYKPLRTSRKPRDAYE